MGFNLLKFYLRSDLNPASGTYPFDALGHRDHGATGIFCLLIIVHL